VNIFRVLHPVLPLQIMKTPGDKLYYGKYKLRLMQYYTNNLGGLERIERNVNEWKNINLYAKDFKIVRRVTKDERQIKVIWYYNLA
jgi:hypothetical protein